MALEVIEHQPEIQICQKDAITLKKEDIKGQIDIKNVCFTYPTRNELKVLSNFSLTIKAGQTTALVGPSGCGKSTII